MNESYSGDGSRAGDEARAKAMRAAQHEMNVAVAALLAEAQLLELEPLADEHLRAVGRIIELARRVAKAGRRLDGSGR
jgi:hypothetical protein